MAGIYTQTRWFFKEKPKSNKFNGWNRKVGNSVRSLMTATQSPSPNQGELDYVLKVENRFLDKVIFFDQSLNSYVPVTQAVRNASVLPAIPEGVSFAENDVMYFGHDRPFGSMVFRLNPTHAGATTITWEYWNVDTEQWTQFTSITDDTNGFDLDNEQVYWITTPPTNYDFLRNPDWGPVVLDEAVGMSGVDGTKKRWWVRGTMPATPPSGAKITQVYLDSEEDTGLMVTQNYSADLNDSSVWIFPGMAYVRERLFELSEVTKLLIPYNGSTTTRFDAIVLDSNDGTIKLTRGIPSCTPEKPLIKPFEYKLADIRVFAGSSTVFDQFITDTRLISGFMQV